MLQNGFYAGRDSDWKQIGLTSRGGEYVGKPRRGKRFPRPEV
jgi:hypothetical protein